MWPDDPETGARLIYLALLLGGLAFVVFAGGGRLGRNLRDLAIWLLILVMVVIAYGFRDTLRRELFPAAMVELEDGAIELRRGADGHFHADLAVNGRPVRFLVDTGASGIVLSRADAEAVGIDLGALGFTGRAMTANGMVAIAPVRLDRASSARSPTPGFAPASAAAGSTSRCSGSTISTASPVSRSRATSCGSTPDAALPVQAPGCSTLVAR